MPVHVVGLPRAGAYELSPRVPALPAISGVLALSWRRKGSLARVCDLRPVPLPTSATCVYVSLCM